MTSFPVSRGIFTVEFFSRARTSVGCDVRSARAIARCIARFRVNFRDRTLAFENALKKRAVGVRAPSFRSCSPRRYRGHLRVGGAAGGGGGEESVRVVSHGWCDVTFSRVSFPSNFSRADGRASGWAFVRLARSRDVFRVSAFPFAIVRFDRNRRGGIAFDAPSRVAAHARLQLSFRNYRIPSVVYRYARSVGLSLIETCTFGNCSCFRAYDDEASRDDAGNLARNFGRHVAV